MRNLKEHLLWRTSANGCLWKCVHETKKKLYSWNPSILRRESINMLTSKKNTFFKKELLVAASYKKTLALKSLFSSEYCQILRAPTLENICARLLLKMCSWNWEKLKFIKSFNFTLRNQYQYSTSVSETSENVSFYFMIGFPWRLYLQRYYFGVARNKLQTLNI